MIQQLMVGSGLIALTVAIQVCFVISAAAILSRIGERLILPPRHMRAVTALVTVVLWLLLGVTICVWLWAVMFIVMDALASLEEALYFATVTFTTLGYGDVTLGEGDRILASMCAVNGLVVFGLNTAFTFEFFIRLRAAQESIK